MTATAIGFTGYWESSFFFCLVPPVVVAGFAWGFAVAVPLSAVVAGAVQVSALASGEPHATRVATAGASELILVALVAGYARRLFGEAELRTSHALSRLRSLAEANVLLLQLNQVAQTLPASLDLEETLRSTVDQLKTMLLPDVAAVLVWDAPVRRWSLTGDGIRPHGPYTEAELPGAVKRVTNRAFAFSQAGAEVTDLNEEGPGLAPTSRQGIYTPLVARDMLVGVLAVENQQPDSFTEHDLALIAGLSEQAALAIDNARWFGRLRTLGAEEERSRIARDLHDRVAQSLAYLAFELDRISHAATTRPVTAELEALRHDVRHVVTEVRDTLYDLRTNVTETQDLVETLEGFLDRVASRSKLEVRFEHRVNARLPLTVERELWRIAQEAVTNVEHHARASHLTVLWESDATLGELSVVDDGRGFPIEDRSRLDSYGLLGMRERADAIGAALYIDSTPGKGTTVRCRLEAT